MVPDLFKRMASVIKSAFTAASKIGLLAFRRCQVGSWLQTISAKVVLREQTTTFVTSAPAHANAVAAMWYASMRCGLILPAVGLDVEWVKGSACPAALLQLSAAMSTSKPPSPFMVFRRAVNGRASPRGEPGYYRGLCPCVWIQDTSGLSLWKVKVGRSHASANEMSDSRDERARALLL